MRHSRTSTHNTRVQCGLTLSELGRTEAASLTTLQPVVSAAGSICHHYMRQHHHDHSYGHKHQTTQREGTVRGHVHGTAQCHQYLDTSHISLHDTARHHAQSRKPLGPPNAMMVWTKEWKLRVVNVSKRLARQVNLSFLPAGRKIVGYLDCASAPSGSDCAFHDTRSSFDNSD